MHLTIGMKVWRNQYYIKYVLQSVYNLADKIVIAFGPVKQMTVWKPDETAQILKEFPDPDKKIKIISQPSWPGITSMVNSTYAEAKELYMKLDGDEIISPELCDEIKANLNYCTKPNKPIIMGNIHFIRSFKMHVVKSTIDPWRLRIFKISPKHKWCHPDFVPGVFAQPKDPGLRLKNPIFHYPYVRPAVPTIIKLSYHWMHWQKYKFKDALRMAEDRLVRLRDNNFSWKFKEWTGDHPVIMQDHPFRNLTFPWKYTKEQILKKLKIN